MIIFNNLPRLGALTASLNWYRGNLRPSCWARCPNFHRWRPKLGTWSTDGHYLDGERAGCL